MRRIRGGIVLLLLIVWMTGCSMENEKGESQEKAIDFTVVEARKIPEELLQVIEENREKEIRMTFTQGEDLYLVRGYGKQNTGGYSISVVKCTEDEETVWFDTRLLGPENQEEISRDPSYPYLVVKMEAREKEVMIQ